MIRLFNHYFSLRVLVLTLVEALVLFQSLVVGFEIWTIGKALPAPITQAVLFALIMLLMMTALGLYDAYDESFRVTLQRIIVAYGLTLITISVIFYVFSQTYVERGVFAVASVFALAGEILVRLFFFRVTAAGLPRRRVLVLGNGVEAEQVIRFLNEGARGRTIQYAGLYPVVAERDANGKARTINHDHLLRTIRDLNVGEIVIAVREQRGGVLPLRQLLDAKLRGIQVIDLATFYERELGMLYIDHIKASWLIFGEGFSQGLLRDVVKRVFDLFFGLLLLVISLPVQLLAVLAIIIDSGLPILYRQERVGQGGRTFTIVKFRTMVDDAEKDGTPCWAQQGDARITRAGRFLRLTRIDELPQLFNVLRGDMSFVGPRPERPFFVRHLLEDIPFYDLRHSVKPGITGWSQVRYPYGASVGDSMQKLQYDLYYVKNHSLFLDLLILVDTVQVVLLGKGAR
ncbi:MAG: TIGR03013 family PEP-CTERM/XrtA system glycosyltransferase [Burkholderiaceae bacterium]|nr:TIGR03013 family PEP-CTERM/XrtA system glycosyltransferase [Burkholderiaceae bacterium]